MERLYFTNRKWKREKSSDMITVLENRFLWFAFVFFVATFYAFFVFFELCGKVVKFIGWLVDEGRLGLNVTIPSEHWTLLKYLHNLSIYPMQTKIPSFFSQFIRSKNHSKPFEKSNFMDTCSMFAYDKVHYIQKWIHRSVYNIFMEEESDDRNR